ncbi:MAG: malonyl-CoA decarboxylase [Pseudomonadota bacterium]
MEEQSTLGRALSSVMEVGRDLLVKRGLASPPGTSAGDALAAMCHDLLHHRGEASGLALAGEILETYGQLDEAGREAFFLLLAREFDVDPTQIGLAADAYLANPDQDNLAAMSKAVEAPRVKLFRRINMAPNGTRVLVGMRGHLLPLVRKHAELAAVDTDLKHLFISWFNKGFLELRRVDWSAPAFELEKIIDYEAVHEINGWSDLRSRLGEDRRCFAFFHPALAHDPLVFVEVALTDEMPSAIAPLLKEDRDPIVGREANTVVFYSISNCHAGLAGISFGNFLIKNVVEELRKEMPWLKTFVTLSPVPGFRRWLEQAEPTELDQLIDPNLVDKVRQPIGRVVEADVAEALQRLCAHYLVNEKSGELLAKDPVARFHLGNGAHLHRLHWAADLTAKGRQQSAGIMVNYLYDLDKIEVNHEAYFDEGKISASKAVTKLIP